MAYNPPIGSIYHLYTTYILPFGGLYATYHLLGEPETTIEYVYSKQDMFIPSNLQWMYITLQHDVNVHRDDA